MESEPGESAAQGAGHHLRGSSVLLIGRLLALAVEFAAHVLAVQYLAKEDYGSYAYALAIALLLSTIVVLGLSEAVSRYVPDFQERRERGHMVGTVLVALAVVGIAGTACVAVVFALRDPLAVLLGDPEAALLLAVLVFTVPLDGINLTLQAMFAALGRVRLIFVRQYVLVPLLRIGVVASLIWLSADTTFLAAGYVATSGLGVLLYAFVVGRWVKAGRLLTVHPIRWPMRDVLSFALPVFVTNAFWIALLAFSTVLLGALASVEEVAAFHAVQPPARLNYLVMSIFAILFLPAMARLFAQNRLEAMREMYTVTTTWLVVLTFPVLAITTAFAPTFVTAFFGAEYRSSAVILILTSTAYYIHTSAGPNSATLKVFRRFKYTVSIDVVALVLGIVLNATLIPIAGAVGAALAFLLAIIGRNLPYLWALYKITGITLITKPYLQVQATLGVALGALVALELSLDISLFIALIASTLTWVAVVMACRRQLKIEDVFPELARTRLGSLLTSSYR